MSELATKAREAWRWGPFSFVAKARSLENSWGARGQISIILGNVLGVLEGTLKLAVPSWVWVLPLTLIGSALHPLYLLPPDRSPSQSLSNPLVLRSPPNLASLIRDKFHPISPCILRTGFCRWQDTHDEIFNAPSLTSASAFFQWPRSDTVWTNTEEYYIENCLLASLLSKKIKYIFGKEKK